MPAPHDAVPKVLDRALEVSPGDWPSQALDHVLTALVIARPIGWISAVSASGVRTQGRDAMPRSTKR